MLKRIVIVIVRVKVIVIVIVAVIIIIIVVVVVVKIVSSNPARPIIAQAAPNVPPPTPTTVSFQKIIIYTIS